MKAICLFSVSFALAALIGCGRGVDVAEQPAKSDEVTSIAPESPGPQDVVSQFLDRVRRGGEESQAGLLLTSKARGELKRIGRSVQPIGSPDARFRVTRSEAVPGEDRSVLVHTIWSEPNGDGTESEFQVVWAVEKDPVQWRISGLAMELVPGEDPQIIDFENGDLMARLLSEAEAPAQAAASSPLAR